VPAGRSPMGTVAHIRPMARRRRRRADAERARPDGRPRLACAAAGRHDWTATLGHGVKNLRIATARGSATSSTCTPRSRRARRAVTTLADLGVARRPGRSPLPDLTRHVLGHWTSGRSMRCATCPRKFALLSPLQQSAGRARAPSCRLPRRGAGRMALGERMKRFHLDWDLLAARARGAGVRGQRVAPREPTGLATTGPGGRRSAIRSTSRSSPRSRCRAGSRRMGCH
jgi:hypothetical protein